MKEKVSELQNTSTGKDNNAVLQAICELCSDTIPYYNWFGFYIVSKEKENMLNLGPYSGEPTEHVKIPFGVGICGQAASSKKTYLIDDVSDEKNYLSCSINVKSEIVVPVFKEDTLVAEIDIDSHTKEAFTELDKKFLEELATIVAPFIELS
ncbi:MAG: GAF domain-containing protein [Spirochaetes bacterium]|nr:GAF domain-containing protein [Spirochaetota bacterium]NLJ05838.1 GAF domain-containing protein [Exilispira sp.]